MLLGRRCYCAKLVLTQNKQKAPNLFLIFFFRLKDNPQPNGVCTLALILDLQSGVVLPFEFLVLQMPKIISSSFCAKQPRNTSLWAIKGISNCVGHIGASAGTTDILAYTWWWTCHWKYPKYGIVQSTNWSMLGTFSVWSDCSFHFDWVVRLQ